MDPRIEALQKEIRDLAAEVIDKTDMPLDRVEAIEAEIGIKAAALDKIEAENKSKAVEAKLAELDERFKAFARTDARTKASAILAGANAVDPGLVKIGKYSNENFLSALVNRRIGDTDAQEFVKAVLGTTDATGQAIVPNNFVAGLVEQHLPQRVHRHGSDERQRGGHPLRHDRHHGGPVAGCLRLEQGRA